MTAKGGSATEVFAAFLKLGLTAFGGPIAHLGYFRTEFVERRKWLDDAGYADLVALCQFLPGPASSQVGFALGLMRAGPLGALAAWTAFTLPSAILLLLFACGATAIAGPFGDGLIAGLKIVAVAIVAQAVLGMARTLCPDRTRAGIAIAAMLLALGFSGSPGQLGAIVMGGLAGWALCRNLELPVTTPMHFPVSRRAGVAALGLFAALLIGLPLLAAASATPLVPVFDAFYRAGALVFGGGHVVLPLLDATLVQTGWLGESAFLAGYGAAQAVPGPLFTFAAYLGAVLDGPLTGLSGGAVALAAIFLPGLLLVVGAMPFWTAMRSRPAAQAGMRGANAAVVGILGAALYTPVFTGAIDGSPAFALAALCFFLLVIWKTPPWVVVVIGAAGGMALSLV